MKTQAHQAAATEIIKMDCMCCPTVQAIICIFMFVCSSLRLRRDGRVATIKANEPFHSSLPVSAYKTYI